MPSNSQYLNTVLNDSTTIPSHLAPAPVPAPAPSHSSTNTSLRPRQFSAQSQQHAQQAQPFSEAQRSAQARGKPFHASASTKPGRGKQSEPESYAQRQRRHEAAAILDSQEMLLWYSAARNESVTQTRQYYLNIVLGVPEAPKDWMEEWEVKEVSLGDGGAKGSPRGKGKGKEQDKEKELSKKRYSSAGPHITYGEEN